MTTAASTVLLAAYTFYRPFLWETCRNTGVFIIMLMRVAFLKSKVLALKCTQLSKIIVIYRDRIMNFNRNYAFMTSCFEKIRNKKKEGD